MGDVMTLIGRHKWAINMVGTIQSNQSGGGKKGLVDTAIKALINPEWADSFIGL
jgi:hypothetical protein